MIQQLEVLIVPGKFQGKFKGKFESFNVVSRFVYDIDLYIL